MISENYEYLINLRCFTFCACLSLCSHQNFFTEDKTVQHLVYIVVHILLLLVICFSESINKICICFTSSTSSRPEPRCLFSPVKNSTHPTEVQAKSQNQGKTSTENTENPQALRSDIASVYMHHSFIFAGTCTETSATSVYTIVSRWQFLMHSITLFFLHF